MKRVYKYLFMNTYQLTILVSPEVQEDSLSAVLGKITEAVQKLGGIVEQQDMQKKIQLAYPIQRQSEAYRSLLTFAMDPKEVEAFQNLLYFLCNTGRISLADVHDLSSTMTQVLQENADTVDAETLEDLATISRCITELVSAE